MTGLSLFLSVLAFFQRRWPVVRSFGSSLKLGLASLFFPDDRPDWKRITMLLLGIIVVSVGSFFAWIIHHNGAGSAHGGQTWDRPFDF